MRFLTEDRQVRPSKWYTAKRPPGRPPRRSATRPEQKSRRFWRGALAAVPLIISVAALTLSYLGYHDEHAQHVSDLLQARQADASRVSLFENDANTVYTIENLGPNPINNVWLEVGVYPVYPSMKPSEKVHVLFARFAHACSVCQGKSKSGE